MNLHYIQQLDKQHHMNTYGQRNPVCFTHGNGLMLYNSQNTPYYDFMGGIAVNAFGHSHPVLVEAICDQAKRLIHTSNLYYISNQALAAQKICQDTIAEKVFFSNSGAEANEGAMKLARNYFYKKGKSHKNEIITIVNSFHGRTLATLAATGQEKFHKPYRPLIPGFKYATINQAEELEALVGPNTAAIMLEVIQGESGVHALTHEYMELVDKLCRENEILLIVDEIQTGMGRTGKLMAHEQTPLNPHIFTLAKALGGGLPVGAVCAVDEVASFEPGDHGSTFGGNPLATRAVLAAFSILENEDLCNNAADMGVYFKGALQKLKKHCPIDDIRVHGLMIGVDVAVSGALVKEEMFKMGYLVGITGNTIRILPPLSINKRDIDGFCEALKASFDKL